MYRGEKTRKATAFKLVAPAGAPFKTSLAWLSISSEIDSTAIVSSFNVA